MIRLILAAAAALTITTSAASAQNTLPLPEGSYEIAMAFSNLEPKVERYLRGVERLETWKLSHARGAEAVRPEARPDRLKERHELDLLPTTLKGASEFMCMAVSLYHEARGEGVAGMAAVGSVVLNRVGARNHIGGIRWGSTICDVTVPTMFSYLNADLSFAPIEEYDAWVSAMEVARQVMVDGPDPFLMDADHYHTENVRPDWGPEMTRVEQIGAHIFYKDPRTATPSVTG